MLEQHAHPNLGVFRRQRVEDDQRLGVASLQPSRAGVLRQEDVALRARRRSRRVEARLTASRVVEVPQLVDRRLVGLRRGDGIGHSGR